MSAQDDCYEKLRANRHNISSDEYDKLVDECYNPPANIPAVTPKHKPLPRGKYRQEAPPEPPVYIPPKDDYIIPDAPRRGDGDAGLLAIVGGGTVLGVTAIAGATALGIAALVVGVAATPGVINTSYTYNAQGQVTGQQTTTI